MTPSDVHEQPAYKQAMIFHDRYPAVFWTIMAGFAVIAVLFFSGITLVQRVSGNTDRTAKAICAEIHYLDNVAAATAGRNPGATKALRALTRDLRKLVDCPPVSQSLANLAK